MRTSLALSSALALSLTGCAGSARLSSGGAAALGSDEGGWGSLIITADGPLTAGARDDCPEDGEPLEIPVQIDDRTNRVKRAPGISGFLLPVARARGLYSLNRLVVIDEAGQRVPAQLEVLGRWGGDRADCARPIRYAYAHVAAVPAPGQRARVVVKNVAERSGEPSPLRLEERADAWVVDTGAARFTLRRDRFQGLSRVELPDGAGGHRVVSALEAGEPGLLIEHRGEKHTSALAPWSYVLERRGPLVVTVAARGYYAAPGGPRDLAYTTRLHFYAGSSLVRIEHTYYHGEVEGWHAGGAGNTTQVGRAWMRLPLAEAVTGLEVRGEDEVLRLAPGEVTLEQEKRSPEAPEVRWSLRAKAEVLAEGEFARRPYLAALGRDHHVVATLARMGVREPAGLRFDPRRSAVELDFTSSPMQVGGARGIWAVAAVDFGAGPLEAARADAVQLQAERPLLGAPLPAYVNTTETIGPYAEHTRGPWSAWFGLMADIHERTRRYLEDYRVTGAQLWPDLPRASCYANYDCGEQRSRLHEGGDNNYWNWSKPGIDEFFRTGINDFLYDFSLGEAITYAETLAFRTYHDRVSDSSVMGLAACYGDSRGYGGDYREGLNHRRDRCVADYSYDKMLKLAFLATGDGRFIDFFEEAGQSVVNALGPPHAKPDPYLEVNLNRLSEQRLEVLTAGAELARDPERGALLRRHLEAYVTSMLGRVLIDGHHCEVGSHGTNDTRTLGFCQTSQAWMMPVGVEWATRAARFLEHPALLEWVIQHGARSTELHAVPDDRGLPDFSRARTDWLVEYRCATDTKGVVAGSCQRQTKEENDGRFWANGLVAFLNLYGLVLAADPSDPLQVCAWLPEAYGQLLASLDDLDINARIWGKASGQAFGMSAEAIGALSRCP